MSEGAHVLSCGIHANFPRLSKGSGYSIPEFLCLILARAGSGPLYPIGGGDGMEGGACESELGSGRGLDGGGLYTCRE